MLSSPSPDAPTSTPPAEATAPVADPATVSVPPVSPPPAPLTWPQWFWPADIALAVSVVVIAFLLASFSPRNSDFFLHISSGRLIANGQFSPGSDPFSHVAPERPWVQWTWLTDLLMYTIYTADPSGLPIVAVKAALIALAFGVLFLLRKPDQPIWPWGVLIALGAIATGTLASLRPSAVSLVFLAVTLVLLHRGNWTTSKWKWPGILAGVFAVWANCDGWFVLGPILVLLYVLGEWLHSLIAGGDTPTTEVESPIYSSPPLGALLRVLALGTAACLLNPTFLVAMTKSPADAMSQILPVELALDKPASMAEDRDLVVLTFTPLDARTYVIDGRGLQPYGVAFAALVVIGGGVLAMGFAGSRATPVVVWVGFAAISLLSTRMIPFFAVVSIAITAMQFNLISSRITLQSWADAKTRIVLIGSGIGRILSITAAFAIIAASYPGWLHPMQLDASSNQRLAWSIEPDAGLLRTVKRIDSWRTEGKLPDSAHGLHLSPDLGDYLAWFAPKEKVFVNSRYNYHWNELPDLLALRKIAHAQSLAEGGSDARQIADLSERYGTNYVAIAVRNRQLDALEPFNLVFRHRQWVFWHLDGRSAVLGRIAARSSAPEAFDQLAFDPVAMAFGPSVEKVPDGIVADLPPAERPLEEQYFLISPPSPPEADDVTVWSAYSQEAAQQAAQAWMEDPRRGRESLARAAVAPFGLPLLMPPGNPPLTDAEFALPLLMVRAARKAIAADPDGPEGYYALFRAYRQPLAPTSSETDRNLQIVTSLARFFARMQPPEKTSPRFARTVAQDAEQMSRIFYGERRLDLAHLYLKKSLQYLEATRPDDFPSDPKSKTDGRTRKIDEMKKNEETLANQIEQIKSRYKNENDPTRKFYAAVASGMLLDAIAQFKKTETPDVAFGRRALEVAIALVGLELTAGRLEDAVADLTALQENFEKMPEADKRNPATAGLGAQLRQLRATASRLAGEHASLIEYRFEYAAQSIPRLTPVERVEVQRPLPPLPFAVSGVTGPVGLLSLQSGLTVQAAENLRQEAATRIDCGMIALESGDTKQAKEQFEFARKPQGIELAPLLTRGHLDTLLRFTAIYGNSQQFNVGAAQQQQERAFQQLVDSSSRAERYLELIQKAQAPR